MNKAWKGITATAIICFILGIALMIVAVANGGSFERIRQNVSLSEYNKSFGVSDVKALDLNIGLGRLSIHPGDEFRVEAENIAEDYFVCELRGDTLVIEDRWTESWALNFARGLSFQSYEPRVKVYVPESVKLRNSEIRISAGACNIDGLWAERLLVAVSAGSLRGVDIRVDEFISNISAGECRIESLITKKATASISAGELHIAGVYANQFQLEQSAGAAFISGDILDRGKFDCGIGRIEVELEGRPLNKYEISVEVDIGSVSVNGNRYSGNVKTSLGSGDSKIELNCNVGEIVMSAME